MSSRLVLCAIGVAALVLSTNTGCYYDQLLEAQRANGVLKEELARANVDLHDAQSMNQVLNGKIDSLKGQLDAKQQTVESLTAENESLRSKWDKAMAALEKMAGQGIGEPVIVTQALPKELDTALKEFAAKYPNAVEYLPEKGVVRWKSDLLFDVGSDHLQESISAALREFAQIVNSPSANGFDVIVVGHTCNTWNNVPAVVAEHKTNWHLSTHRAISVMNALQGEGISPTRMGVMGYGEFRPIAANTTAASKEQNRRVEIFLMPSEKVAATGTAGVFEAKDANLQFAKPSSLEGSSEEASPVAPKVE